MRHASNFTQSKAMLALACVLTICLGTPAQAGNVFPSKVTFRQSDQNEAKFKGRVFSGTRDCFARREVKIFRVAPGPNQKITETRASKKGKYAVEIPMQTENALYARVGDDVSRLGNHCQHARSEEMLAT